MNKVKRIALLDTDFIIKSHISMNNDDEYLFSHLINLNQYDYCMHEKIFNELSGNLIIQKQIVKLIEAKKIKCYSDSEILKILEKIYGKISCLIFIRFLKISCDKLETGFFNKYYNALENLNSGISSCDFLKVLYECESIIPVKTSMGEKKTFVLLQTLKLINENEIYVFCSDDRRARLSALQFPGIRCLTVLALIASLYKRGEPIDTIKSYYYSLCSFFQKHSGGFKVWKKHPNGFARQLVNFDILFNDIINNRMEIRADGDLVYRKDI